LRNDEIVGFEEIKAMKKIVTLLIILIVIGVGVLSGCTQEQTTDYDKDGYNDNIDAFPYDPAASKDSDGDNYPDNWNTGMNKDDSTSYPQLELDAFPNDPTEWKDTDGDGYGDNSDDFPEDMNLHEKIVVDDYFEKYTEQVPPGSWGGTEEWIVTSDAKYVFVKSQEEYLENGAWVGCGGDINIDIYVSNPETEYRYEDGFGYPYAEGHRITVTSENWGTWRMRLHNYRDDGKAARSDYAIYIYK